MVEQGLVPGTMMNPQDVSLQQQIRQQKMQKAQTQREL
jgi:hypothetical protein